MKTDTVVTDLAEFGSEPKRPNAPHTALVHKRDL